MAVLIAAGVIMIACVILPLGTAAARIALGAWRGSPLPDGAPGLAAGTLNLLASSVGWSVLIAATSTVLAFAAAWTLWRCGPVARAALVVPLLVPSTLAFAGWGLLRAPNTWIGSRLELAAQAGWHEAPVIAGRLLAVLGLALWAFPLGAIVIWSGLRATDSAVIESMRADGAGRLCIVREIVRLCRGDLFRAVLLVALVMLGSAVPLHLAQIETLAIQVWFALDNLGVGQRWRAWAAAWPLVLIAVIAGWWVGGRVASFDPGELRTGDTRHSWKDAAVGGVPWTLAVLVPLSLFVANLGQASKLGRFWESNGSAIGRSVAAAACVAAASLVLSLAVAWGKSRSRVLAVGAIQAARLLVISALIPGVLIGSAVGGMVSISGAPWLDDSLLPVVGAHVARYGFLGMFAGCWAANTSRRLVGDISLVDGADSWTGWWRASLQPALGIHLGAAGAAGVLSLHEIEATVQVMPPGDCLARVILGDLHYSRVADMAAAGVWLVGAGLAPVVVVCAWRALRGRKG